MADGIKEKLDKEIERELDEMYLAHPNEEGYSAATERLETLYKLKIDEAKAESEVLTTNQQLAESKKDRWIKLGVEVAGIVLPLGFYGIWMGRGLKFEQTGSFTSTTFRGLINRFRPTK